MGHLQLTEEKPDDSGPMYHLPLTARDIPVWTTRILVASFVVMWAGVHLIALNSNQTYVEVVFGLALQSTEAQPYQFLSYIFVHGNVFHLFINSYVMLSFGKIVHYELGSTRRYLALFFFGGVVAGGGQVLANLLAGIGMPLVGASGGLSALIGYHALRNPTSEIKLFFIKRMSALRGVTYFIVISAGAVAIWGLGAGGFAHVAHLAGLFFGFFAALYLHAEVRKFARLKLRQVRQSIS